MHEGKIFNENRLDTGPGKSWKINENLEIYKLYL